MGFKIAMPEDQTWIGLLVGLVFPPVVVYLLAISVHADHFVYSESYFENISLMAIGLNAGLMWLVLNKLKKDRIGRGILLTTFAYVIAFVIYFYT
jgi:chromate transport protein ChrA